MFSKKDEVKEKDIRNRWERAQQRGDINTAYKARYEYSRNIEQQQKQLQEMDPNSPEYDRFSENIDEQRGYLYDMDYEQRRAFSSTQKRDVYEQLNDENEENYAKMKDCIERGDVKNYEAYRKQYEDNLGTQERLGSEMKSDKFPFEDTEAQSKRDLLHLDVDMRNKIYENIQQKESKGKAVSEEERAMYSKYDKMVQQDERATIDAQNAKRYESMEAQGVSNEEIQRTKENDARARDWYTRR